MISYEFHEIIVGKKCMYFAQALSHKLVVKSFVTWLMSKCQLLVQKIINNTEGRIKDANLYLDDLISILLIYNWF